LNNLVYVNQLPLRSTFLEELADPADNLRRALSVFTIRDAASRASSMFGVSPASQRRQVFALVLAAAIG